MIPPLILAFALTQLTEPGAETLDAGSNESMPTSADASAGESVAAPDGGQFAATEPLAQETGIAQDDGLNFEPHVHAALLGSAAAVVRSDGTAGFGLGDLDVFVTGSFGPKLRALAEILIEVKDDHSFALDLERVELGYTFDERLTVAFGRMHQDLGRWNTQYHHGSVFFDAVHRPRIVEFEDEGGLLPVHLMGLQAGGELALSETLGLHWGLEVGNGRGRSPTDILNLADLNLFKSVGGQLALLSGDGLEVGVNLLHDRIPGEQEVGETIAALYAAFEPPPFRLTGEAYLIRHQAGDATLDHWGGFLELGAAFGAFRPFVRGELIDFANATDSFFAQSPQPDWFAVRGGVRWSITSMVAAKFEYSFLREFAPPRSQHEVWLQLAFGL